LGGAVGFLADLSHRSPAHEVVRLALSAVSAMEHRGARAADGRSGDGAGILIEPPRAIFMKYLSEAHVRVPEQHLAAVCVFLPVDEDLAAAMRAKIEHAIRFEGVKPLRWRVPPADFSVLGKQAVRSAPSYEQLLVDVGPGNPHERMRSVRRAVIRTLRDEGEVATLISASTTAVVYKALLSSTELGTYFGDLHDPMCTSRYAVFHQRFATNTPSSWRLVQPFSIIAHNGEIDTIAGNRAWMRARGVVSPRGASDSLEFNVALDAIIGSGYRIDEAVDLMLSPTINDDDRLRAYYDAHILTVEPWDGPAAIAFADGDRVGAALDRSGFRPLRWCRTQSGKVLAASEAGVVDFGDDPIIERGRLGPGDRLMVQFDSGQLLRPDAFRALRRDSVDFRATVQSWRFELPAEAPRETDRNVLQRNLVRFGYTAEELKQVVLLLARGAEPTWSKGYDVVPAFLERLHPVTDYLRQRFAQVTSAPIDMLREGFVFDMRAFVGRGDTNGDVPAPGSIVSIDTALLDEGAFDALTFDARLVPHRIALDCSGGSLRARIAAICDEAENAVSNGVSYVVLDDRDAALPVPAVLAAGAVHQRLTAKGLRMQTSIAACDGFARDAHGCAAVIAAGANVMTPWLAARAAVNETRSAGTLLEALRAGLVKVLAKLGICTLRSYVGAQTFEALGLHREITEKCFPGMTAHVATLSFEDLEEDLRVWAALAADGAQPPQRGQFRYPRDGVENDYDSPLLKNLRKTIVARDEAAFLMLSDQLEERQTIALRDLVEPVALGDPIPLEDVEPEEAIAKRFVSAAMSLGALGPEAHEAVALGATLAGARIYAGGSSGAPVHTRSARKRAASSGVGIAPALAAAYEIEIDIAEDAKRAAGGQVPGFEVTADVAALRGAVTRESLIFAAPHHDIYSIEDLAQLIYDLRRANAQATIAVKLVAQSGIGFVASGVAKARADVVHIAGRDGGIGASPLGSIEHSGVPWELGLVETHHTLVANGLRGRVALRVDGGFKTGRDVIVAAMLGADMFGFRTALWIALGYGFDDPDDTLRGTAEDAATFLRFVARDVRRRLAALGARSFDEIHGRSDLVRPRYDRARGVDLDELLRLPETRAPYDVAPLDLAHLDDEATPGGLQRITPADRAVGARIAYDAVLRKARGERFEPAPYRYIGSAGQSFGAYLTAPLTLELDGEANDGVGTGMSGGTLIVRGAGRPDEPAIGNYCFFAALGGTANVRGAAGERLAMRNDGATIIVAGAGDYACESMTAGTVVIIGDIGRRFASGMSGGALFVLRNSVPSLGATSLVPRELQPREAAWLSIWLFEHALRTGSNDVWPLLDRNRVRDEFVVIGEIEKPDPVIEEYYGSAH
jgi:glutamate synthase (NADPH) large chain